MQEGEAAIVNGALTAEERRREAEGSARAERARRIRVVSAVVLIAGIGMLVALPVTVPPGWLSRPMVSTAAALLCFGLYGLCLATLVRHKWPEWYVQLGLWLGGIGMAVMLAANWIGVRPGRRTGRDLEWLVLMFFLIGLHYLLLGPAARELGRAAGVRRWVSMVSIGMVFASGALSAGSVWVSAPPQGLIAACWIGVMAAAASAQAVLVRVRHEGAGVRATGPVALAFAWACAVFFSMLAAKERDWDEDMVMRIGTGLLLGTISFTIANIWLVTHRKRREAGERGERWAFAFPFRCPSCGTAGEATTGRSSCSSCGLGLRIGMSPRRCLHCGYAMSGLAEAVCPECGADFR